MGDSIGSDAERQYYATLYANYLIYHNHKENLAHAAMVAQVAFVLAVLTWGGWPPGCASLHPWCWRLGVWVLWLGFYLYAGWEMRLRRYAAAVCLVLQRELGQVVGHGRKSTGNQERRNKCQLCKFLRQYVLWFPWGLILKTQNDNRGYPKHIEIKIQDQLEAGDRYLTCMETLAFVLSILIVGVLCVTAFS